MNEKLIFHLLTTDHAECNLHELAPITDENKKKLIKMRDDFIKKGKLLASQKISDHLKLPLSKNNLEKIISVCWRKHRVSEALESISLLINNDLVRDRSILQQALDKCLAGAKSPDYYHRPRYQAAIPKIMAMTQN